MKINRDIEREYEASLALDEMNEVAISRVNQVWLICSWVLGCLFIKHHLPYDLIFYFIS